MNFFYDFEFIRSDNYPLTVVPLSCSIVCEIPEYPSLYVVFPFEKLPFELEDNSSFSYVEQQAIERRLDKPETDEWFAYFTPPTKAHVNFADYVRIYFHEIGVANQYNRFTIKLWSYYGATDWALFNAMFGDADRDMAGSARIEGPITLPHHDFDIAQAASLLGLKNRPPRLPKSKQHHAYYDALWNRDYWRYVRDQSGNPDIFK